MSRPARSRRRRRRAAWCSRTRGTSGRRDRRRRGGGRRATGRGRWAGRRRSRRGRSSRPSRCRTAGRRGRRRRWRRRRGRRRRRRARPDRRRGGASQSPRPMSTSTPPRAITTGVVGNSATRMKPVPNTPTSEPAVPSAWIRPTTRPVWSTSCSWALAVSGLTALSSADGTKKASVGEHDDAHRAAVLGRRSDRPHDRDRGHRCATAEREGDGQEGAGVVAVGELAATPRPDGDAGEDDPDHAGERLQRDPDVRRQQPPGEDLQHEDAPRGDEHQRSCVPGLHGRRRYRCHRAVALRAAPARIAFVRQGPPGVAWCANAELSRRRSGRRRSAERAGRRAR